LRELKKTRDRGYGLALGENEPGLSAISVRLCPMGGPSKRTLVIVAPAVRMGGEHIVEFVANARNRPRNLETLWPLRRATRRNIPSTKAVV